MTDALVVVDMQNDYCHQEGTCARTGRVLLDGERVVDRVDALLGAARRVGTLVVYCLMSVSSGPVPCGPWQQKRVEREMADVCVEGTWGQEVLTDLAPVAGDHVVHKTRYSGFLGTNLDLLLRTHLVDTCYFAGVTTNGCVDLTLRDAYQRDYRVMGIVDGVGAYDQRLHDAALANWARSYGDVVEASTVITRWR